MAKAKAKPKAAKPVPVPATTDQADFLAAIIANPDDKRARIVYADLLQDQGDPRGEFIMLQCTRAELPPGDKQVAAIEKREAELLKKHKKAWTAFGTTTGARWEYRRGFVEKASCDAVALVGFGDVIFGLEPIEELNVWKIDELPGKTDRLARVLALPLGRIRRLSLARSELTPDDVTALATATTLGNVELLDLTNTNLGVDGAEILATATSLPKLRELRIGNCSIEDDGLAALAKSKTLRFQQLVAARNGFSVAAGEMIANATWAPHLTHLDLSTNDLDDEGLAALANSTTLTNLVSLKLEYALLGDAAAEIVIDAPNFAKLQHLDLSSNLSREDHARVRAVFGDRLKA